jgi:hypothetical protein
MDENIFMFSSDKERFFLELAFRRLKTIREEICFKNSSFWQKDSYYRFARIKEAFVLFTEISSHKSIRLFPNLYDEKFLFPFLTNEVFRFVRNVISHFPLFDSWDDVWISKSLINWNKAGQSIDKFLKNNVGKETLGYAYKEEYEDKSVFPTMVDFNFPKSYDENSKIYLKEMISEKDGIIFSIRIMVFIIEGTQKTINEFINAKKSDSNKHK